MREKELLSLTSTSPPDARWELVRRVAESDYFRKAPKLRAFLLYVCENTILGRCDDVREQLIGSQIFGRRLDYDPSDDNIVRVEARELRTRLEAYFAQEGKHEAVIIGIPKGSYVPVFRPREAPAPLPAEPKEQQVVVAPVVQAPDRARHWMMPVVALGLVVWGAATAWLVIENRRLHQTLNQMGAETSTSLEDYSVYPQLLGTLGTLPNREPQLVLCNPKVILLYGTNTPAPYVGPKDILVPSSKDLDHAFSTAFNGKDQGMPFHFFHVTQNDYTGNGEAMAAFQVARLMDRLRRPVHLTQARFLNWDNVQEQDLILLGGPSSNSWTHQIDATANFIFSNLSVVNLRPLPGEEKQYNSDTIPRPGGEMAEYGIIRMLTTPHGFRTFLLAGLSTAGTAGIAELFVNPTKVTHLADRIAAGAAHGKSFPTDWEAIIRVVVQDGLPVESSPVIVRPAVPTR